MELDVRARDQAAVGGLRRQLRRPHRDAGRRPVRADAGRFVVTNTYERPAGMANLNNEGFAIAPQAECVNGLKPVFWADDSNTGRARAAHRHAQLHAAARSAPDPHADAHGHADAAADAVAHAADAGRSDAARPTAPPRSSRSRSSSPSRARSPSAAPASSA